MNDPSTLLMATVLTPLIGAIVLAFVSTTKSKTLPRWVALVFTLITLGMATTLVRGFLAANVGDGWFAEVDKAWLPAGAGVDVRFHLAIDGIGLWLFGLSALLMVTAVLVSWEAIKDRPALFFAMLLLLEAGCLGVFTARDIILFYICFEFTLIPLFFLIGIWGSEDRRYAATKFFIFTLAGSLLTFIGLLTIVLWHQSEVDPTGITFSIAELTAGLASNPMPSSMQVMVFLALFAGFAIKVPLFPLHTWLPLAHVQAPTAGSVILAGILLKIGTYGFIRFSIPMLPEATATLMPWILWLSVAGIVYGALVALAQSDIKRLIAYSSVSHLGYCMLGLFALNKLGTQGSVLQMVNHGLSTGGLFAIVGMLYERYHTREIKNLGGVARNTPILAFFMLVFTFSSIGLPGMNGFAGEIMILLGMFQRGWNTANEALGGQLRIVAVLALSGVVLGAWYMLWLVQRVFFGPVHLPASETHGVRDLSFREVAALAPLVVFVLWIGLCPQYFLNPMAAPIDKAIASAKSQVDSITSATEAAEVTNNSDEVVGGRGLVRAADNSSWAPLSPRQMFGNENVRIPVGDQTVTGLQPQLSGGEGPGVRGNHAASNDAQDQFAPHAGTATTDLSESPNTQHQSTDSKVTQPNTPPSLINHNTAPSPPAPLPQLVRGQPLDENPGDNRERLGERGAFVFKPLHSKASIKTVN